MRPGHVDKPGCACGRCEPAESVNNPLAMMLSGNPACDFPNCLTVGARCAWGDGFCSPGVRAAVADYEPEAMGVSETWRG